MRTREVASGDWVDDEFLVVPPGHMIGQSFDDKLLEAVPVELAG